MQEFHISLHSFDDVKEFISLATVQPFPVLVGNDVQEVNAKSFIGMLSLDFSRPLQVHADCDIQALSTFQQKVCKFLCE